jgi:hypothetical protein
VAPNPRSRSARSAQDTFLPIRHIVISIDDLDRCPPARVVEMLEAIHLLLALPLFVVVVTVDPRWMLRAIAAHYRDVLYDTVAPTQQLGPGAADEDLWLSSPNQYLEKIFQVVLTLPPMRADGFQALRAQALTRRDDQPTAIGTTPTPAGSSAPGDQTQASTPTATASSARATDPSADLSGAGAGADGEVHLDALPVVEEVSLLSLSEDELRLMDELGPPLLVATPRLAKRLFNSYALLTAIRRARQQARGESADRDRTEQRFPLDTENVPYVPYRAGMVLLAALVAYPSVGPALCRCLLDAALESPQLSWRDFCRTLPDRRLEVTDEPPGGTHRQARDVERQWRELAAALLSVTDRASALGLALPPVVGAWGEWVELTARFSFPSGRVVRDLARRRAQYESGFATSSPPASPAAANPAFPPQRDPGDLSAESTPLHELPSGPEG